MKSIVEEILKFESDSKVLEPESKSFQYTLCNINDYLGVIIDENQNDKAWNAYVAGQTFTPTPLKNSGRPLTEIFHELDYLLKPGLNPASGGHLGYIPGGGIPLGAIGDLIAALNNRYVGVNSVSPGGVEIENSIINWLAELIGYDAGLAGGSLTSGGSIANLTAIVAARDAGGHPPADFPKLAVFMTGQAHHCVHKSLRIAGMDTRPKEDGGQVWYVKTDDTYRMDVYALQIAVEEAQKSGFIPWLLIGSAGTTNTGAIDPIRELANIAVNHKLWFHLDAAYGSFFILTLKGKVLLKDMHLADSIVLDPHKSLFLSYGTGTVILKDREHLLKSFYYQADYLPEEEYAQSNISPELTKHFRALRIWLPIQHYGLAPFRAALEEKLMLAAYAFTEIQKLPFIEIIAPPQLSVFAFRISSYNSRHTKSVDEINKLFVEFVKQDGRVFISGTNLKFKENNCYVLRLAIVSFRTHLDEIDHFIKLLHRFAGKKNLVNNTQNANKSASQ